MGIIPGITLQSILTKQKMAAGEPFDQKGSLQVSLRQETGQTLPANVLLIMDCSGSMRGRPMDMLNGALDSIIQRMRPRDVLSVIAFGTAAETLFMEKTAMELSSGHPGLRFLGKTNYGSAFALAIEMLGQRSATRLLRGDAVHTVSKIALFFTDGHPYGSDPWEDHVSSFTSAGFSLHSLGLGNNVDITRLEDIAEAAGGHYHHADAVDEMEAVLVDILDFSQQVVYALPRLRLNVFPGVQVNNLRLVAPPRPLGTGFGPGTHELLLPDMQSGTVLELVFDILMSERGKPGQVVDLAEWDIAGAPTEVTRVEWVSLETCLLAPASTRPAILSKVYDGLDAVKRGDTATATSISTALAKMPNNPAALTGSTVITRSITGGLSQGKLIEALSKTTTRRDGTIG